MNVNEQPRLRDLAARPGRIAAHVIDLDVRVRHYQVVQSACHIRDESGYALTAQANLEASNAMAVILPDRT